MIRTAFPVLLVAAALAACGPADMVEHDPHVAHPLTAEVKTAVVVFDGLGQGGGLTGLDRMRVERVAAESIRRGAGPVEVVAAPGEENRALGEALAQVLRGSGLVDVRLRQEASDAPSRPAGAAEIRVPVWVAVLPECGTYERGIQPDYGNAPNSDWGCSIQRNLGLMVQNPADLVRAREASGRDANRAAEVLGKYGRGEATGSAAEATNAGTTSKVGNSGR